MNGRKVCAIVIFLAILNVCYSIPNKINVQGRVTDANGIPYSGSYPFTFQLYHATNTPGNLIWTISHSVMVIQGLYSDTLGPLPLDLFTTNDSVIVHVVFNGFALTPDIPLLPSPYAFQAHNADSLGNQPATFYLGVKSISNITPDVNGNVVLTPGTNITIDPNQTNHSLTINATGTSTQISTQEGSGLTSFLNSNTYTLGVNFATGDHAGTGTYVARNDHNHDDQYIRINNIGAGLTGGNISPLAVIFATSGGNNGINDIAARSDHDHDARYIQGVTAGIGLIGGGNAPGTPSLGVNFSGSGGSLGTANSVARSDHSHTNYIDFTSNQSLTGSKTFNGATHFYGSLDINNSMISNSWAQFTYNSSSSNVLSCMTSGTGSTAIYGASSGNNAYGVFVTATGTGSYAIYGTSSASNSFGIYGQSPGNAIKGNSTGSSNSAIGVVGTSTSTSGAGVYGTSTGGNGISGYSTGTGSSATGVSGSSTGGNGVYGQSTASGPYAVGVYGLATASNGDGVIGQATGSSGVGLYGAGPTSGYAGFFSGNMTVSGGTKNALIKTATHGYRLTYCDESTEVLFFDHGFGTLTNGSATIILDPIFLETITFDSDKNEPIVNATPLGDCNGLFISQITSTSFKVKECNHGTSSNVRFNWTFGAKRLGYEQTRLVEVPENNVPKLKPTPKIVNVEESK